MLLLFLQILGLAATTENLLPERIQVDETDRVTIINRRAIKMIKSARNQDILILNVNTLKMTKSNQSVNAEGGEAADVGKGVVMKIV